MTAELTVDSAVAAMMDNFQRFAQAEPQAAREFLWRLHYTLYEDEAEVHHMSTWLYWWDVWPVSWEDACDLISGALTDEQRQLRIAGSGMSGNLAWAQLPTPHPNRVVDG